MIYSVVGSNYGDEGKGLATDYLSTLGNKTLVVRHNGGAQSGHTVETKGLRLDHYDSKRFVFNELSSGSFRGADTFWAQTYFPDLFKLSDELNRFYEVAGFVPKVIADSKTNITIIDDVIINMLLEIDRGEKRHGSCGMGIWEATLRTRAGFGITVEWVKNNTVEDILNRLKSIRRDYVLPRIKSEKININIDENLCELISTDDILEGFAKLIKENSECVEIRETSKEFFESYENVIFESGQGLCLDADCVENFPHVSASKTGINNVIRILDSVGLKLDEAVYITRTYLTKHGAGPLPNEDPILMFDFELDDDTNVYNNWQGDIRYARFGSANEVMNRVKKDIDTCPYDVKSALFVTHLNETSNNILVIDGDIGLEDYLKASRDVFDKFYLSSSKYASDVIPWN